MSQPDSHGPATGTDQRQLACICDDGRRSGDYLWSPVHHPRRAIAAGGGGFDRLVMGAYSHSPLRTWLFGSKTSEMLQASSVPTLLLR